MGAFKDLTGKRFGRLVVLSRHGYGGLAITWECLCDCGSKTVVLGNSLLRGKTQSCGCIRREQLVERNSSHNLSTSRVYSIYQNMRERCYCATSPQYKHYGKRGISVCAEWLSDFQHFYDWAMANGYGEGLTLDRIDVDGNYDPLNCRWVTMKTQQNNRRNNRFITINGITKTLAQWADETGINYDTLFGRVSRGWPEADLFMEPNLANSKIRKEKNSYA